MTAQSAKKSQQEVEPGVPVDSDRSLLQDFHGLIRLWPDLRPNKWFVFGAAALIPLISILQTTLPMLLKWGVDSGILSNDVSVLTMAAGFYLAAVLVEYIIRGCQSVLMALATHRMIRSLRMRLVEHVLRLPARFHDRSMSGALVTRATSDFDNLSESLNMGVLTSIVDIAVLIGCVVGMFILDWRLAIVTVVVLPIVIVVVRQFSGALKKTMLRARRKISILNAFNQECLYGHATVKLLGARPAAKTRFDFLNIDYRNAQMRSVILDASMFAVLDGIASITVGIVLWFTVVHLAGADVISAGVLVAFVQYIQQFFEPVKMLGNKIAMLQGAFTSLDRIFGLLETEDALTGDRRADQLNGDLQFSGVGFRYNDDDRPVLNDVSFRLPAGQSMAIVGATGSGKSTIIKIVAKLYDGYSGQIKIAGQELRDLEANTVRERIAIVPQDITLFDGTVAFNIGLDRPGVDRKAIEEAAQHVGADRFISRLPQGYDTPLREGGTNLSQGQRQLIAFSRALVGSPDLVILDEATSSVDRESEEIIQAAVTNLLAGRTVIVIAHRLATIRQCNQIVVLDKGEILEAGAHDELIAKQQAYYRLHASLA